MNSSIEIRLEFTPNPNALKYVVDDHSFLDRGAANFTELSAAEKASPLAKRLLLIDGVQGCMIGQNFVTITITNDNDIERIDQETRTAVTAHIQSGDKAVNEISLEEGQKVAPTSEFDEEIKAVIDQEIRPAVAMDGGDIIFERFEDGIVYLYMQGACAGCPSSTATLKMGIETRLKSKIPAVKEVIAL